MINAMDSIPAKTSFYESFDACICCVQRCASTV